jgi:hypothetical protein
MRAYTSLRTLKQAGAKVLNGPGAFLTKEILLIVKNCGTSRK